MDDYLFHIMIQACVTSTLAVSLNLLAGYCGMISLGQLIFFAIGAYTAALLAPATSLGYFLVWPVGLSIAALTAVGQSSATVNLKDDEFAIATFAMHAVFWMLLLNWVDLTRGPMGIPNIPPFRIFGFSLDSPTRFLPISVFLLGAALLIVWRLSRSPFGTAMTMMRDDEQLAITFGRDTRKLRRAVTIVAAILAASAGVFHASYVGYIHPVSFSAMESTLLLAIVIVGGIRTLWGPVAGAFVLTGVPEALRFVGLPAAEAANLRQILLGLVLIAIIFRTRASKYRHLWRTAGGTS
jgi:ABC-type branched-subunit amino acid transport system permease subunit